MKKEQKKLIMLMSTMGLIIIGVFFFYLIAFRKDDFDLQTLIFMALIFLILVFMGIIFIKRIKEVKEGMPLEDERSKKVLIMASATAFQFSIYWILSISIFEKFFADLFGVEYLDAGQTVGGSIFGMAVFFVIFYLYYNRKGDLS